MKINKNYIYVVSVITITENFHIKSLLRVIVCVFTVSIIRHTHTNTLFD